MFHIASKASMLQNDQLRLLQQNSSVKLPLSLLMCQIGLFFLILQTERNNASVPYMYHSQLLFHVILNNNRPSTAASLFYILLRICKLTLIYISVKINVVFSYFSTENTKLQMPLNPKFY